MGLDELNKLGQLPLSVLVALIGILALLGYIANQLREGRRDKLLHAERSQDEETERLRIEERKLNVLFIGDMSKAAAQLAEFVRVMSEHQQASFAAVGKQTAEIAERHGADLQAGVEVIQADIKAVPGKVGEVTGPQMNTIRTALAALLEETKQQIIAEVKDFVGQRIEQLEKRQPEVILEEFRADLKALSQRIDDRLDNLAVEVPEKVRRIVLDGQTFKLQVDDSEPPPLTALDNGKPQTAEPHEQAADSTHAAEGTGEG